MLSKKLIEVFSRRDPHASVPLIFKKILIQATLLPMILSLVLSILFVRQVFNVLEMNQRVRYSDQILNLTTDSYKLAIDSETGFRGFVISNNTEYLEPWEKARIKLETNFETLLTMVRENPHQSKLMKKIKALYLDWNMKAEESLRFREKYNRSTPPELMHTRKKLMDEMRLTFDSFIDSEKRIRSTSWEDAENTTRFSILMIICLGLFLGGLLAALSWIQLNKLSKNYDLTFKKLATDSDSLETTVHQKTRDLIMINKELETFSHAVSNDVRPTLNEIDNHGQTLMDLVSDKLGDDGQKNLNYIRVAAQRMGILIDNLLTLSHLTQTEFRMETFDVSSISSDIINELKSQYPLRVVEISNFPSKLILADKELIRLALLNLISNSWKFTQSMAGARIELGIVSKDGLEAFYVKDNGVGFNLNDYDKMFRPIKNHHEEDPFEGRGIGLATVSRIIRRHNGLIWAESEQGSGSVFYFTIGTAIKSNEPLPS